MSFILFSNIEYIFSTLTLVKEQAGIELGLNQAETVSLELAN